MDILSGFAPLVDRYDGFILDLWGVIHDGLSPYPGAVETLARLQAAGKRVGLLSNAPRRAWAVREQTQKIGIDPELYNVVLTSGEITRRLLDERNDPFFAALGPRVYHLGPDRDRSVLEGLEARYTKVASPAEADFVLATDYFDVTSDPAASDAWLCACHARALPMVCANPDFEVVRRDGSRIYCGGMLAKRYEALGGQACWIGKPHKVVYPPMLDLLGTPAEKTLCVGDALRTDIVGATGAGMDGCWVLGGIHAEALAASPLGVEAAARAAAAEAGLAPVAAVPAFVW